MIDALVVKVREGVVGGIIAYPERPNICQFRDPNFDVDGGQAARWVPINCHDVLDSWLLRRGGSSSKSPEDFLTGRIREVLYPNRRAESQSSDTGAVLSGP